MTREQYDTSIATGERQLNGFWERSIHFGAAWFLFITPASLLFMIFYDYMRGRQAFPVDDGLWLVIIPLCLGFLVLWIQKRRLKFKVVQTNLKRDEVKAIIREAAIDLKWKGHFRSANIYEAKTDPGVFSGSRGEQITILLSDNRVFVNSVCATFKKVVPWSLWAETGKMNKL